MFRKIANDVSSSARMFGYTKRLQPDVKRYPAIDVGTVLDADRNSVVQCSYNVGSSGLASSGC